MDYKTSISVYDTTDDNQNRITFEYWEYDDGTPELEIKRAADTSEDGAITYPEVHLIIDIDDAKRLRDFLNFALADK